MLGLKPVKLMPARERVASALRKAIISRQIKEGETLALEATAQELGVSIGRHFRSSQGMGFWN